MSPIFAVSATIRHFSAYSSYAATTSATTSNCFNFRLFFRSFVSFGSSTDHLPGTAVIRFLFHHHPFLISSRFRSVRPVNLYLGLRNCSNLATTSSIPLVSSENVAFGQTSEYGLKEDVNKVYNSTADKPSPEAFGRTSDYGSSRISSLRPIDLDLGLRNCSSLATTSSIPLENVAFDQTSEYGIKEDVNEVYNSTLEAFDQTTDYGCSKDSDKLYKTIIDHSSPEHDMSRALDSLGIELTTSSVIEVLQRLRFEEKLAFRFFTWAGHQKSYSHEPRAYDDMIDILSSTKYKIKQFRIVCDMLDYMKRNNKSSVPVEVLLKILRQYTEKHLTHLQKFAKKKKIRVKTQPEINALNMLLDALCKCSLVEEAEFMSERIKNKVKPDANTYNILFFGWCRVRNPTRGMKVLDDMIKMGHTPDNFTYNTAIDTFCRAGMVTEAGELLEFMKNKGSTMSSPTAKTYAIMIVALAQSDRMDECFKLLGDMISSGSLPDVSTYKEMIEGMCLAGKVDAAYKLLVEMGKNGYPPDIVTYNCFLKVLCENKNADEALRLYEKMIEVGCVPSVQTFNMLITMFFEMGVPDGAFDTWQEMEKRGCPRDTDTYCVMIEGLFGCNQVEDACFLLEEVVNKGMKLPYGKFDSFLMQLSGIGDLGAIHRLSEHMRKFYNPAMARRFALNQKRKSISLRGK